MQAGHRLAPKVLFGPRGAEPWPSREVEPYCTVYYGQYNDGSWIQLTDQGTGTVHKELNMYSVTGREIWTKYIIWVQTPSRGDDAVLCTVIKRIHAHHGKVMVRRRRGEEVWIFRWSWKADLSGLARVCLLAQTPGGRGIVSVASTGRTAMVDVCIT